MDRKRLGIKRAIFYAIAISFFLTTAVYAANWGDIRQNVRIWLHGEQTDGVLETADKGQYTDYTFTYYDESGEMHKRGGASVAYDEDGTQHPATEEEILDYYNTHVDVEYPDDGSVWLYYKDQKADITDRFENDVCIIEFEDGDETVQVTVEYQGTWSVKRESS